MKLSSLFNARNAFNSAKIDDILSTITDDQRKQLQSVLLGMYADVLEVSKEEGITVFLVGGSALGAVRHKGFIPWDDDLDIGFLRNEYEIFLDAFGSKFSDKYIINSPGRQDKTRARFTKIFKKGTLFREMISLPEDELNGIFVDVFPIDNVPDNSILRMMKGIRCDALAYISSQVFYRENMTVELKSAIKRTGLLNYYFRMMIGFVFGFKKSSWWFKRYDKTVQYNKNTNYCTIAAGRRHYFGECIKREVINPPSSVIFCGSSAFLFHDVDEYLRQLYGDYLNIPPENKRERHYVREIQF